MKDENSEWEIKVCDDLDESDLQLVSRFFNEYFPGVFYPECSPRIFQWKLGSGNPSGSGFLTIAIHDGKVIGTTSGTRQRVLKGKRLVTAIEIGDTFTHPDFRRKGTCASLYPGTAGPNDYLNKSIFGRLVTETLDRAQASGIHYVFGTPNENSRPPYLNRLKFQEIGWGRVKSWSSPTQKFKMGSRKSLVVSLATFLLKVLRKINLLISGRNIKIEEDGFESFALGLEAILQNTPQDILEPGSICMDQNLAFFKYRYASHPNYRYQYFKIQVRDRTVGWIICVVLVRQSGRETLVVSDWIIPDRSMEKNLPKYVAILSSKFKIVQLISLWAESTRYSSFEWGRFGFFSWNQVSLIIKTLNVEDGEVIREFADFRIGWSDNG
ncbi:MAG TPA: GNAT family N-acetyltransferase [Candidatus Paceibacterota bacterium]|nr:GNAT family N-acetyltransferase [Candidatus Paceibacterota bacterium]